MKAYENDTWRMETVVPNFQKIKSDQPVINNVLYHVYVRYLTEELRDIKAVFELNNTSLCNKWVA